MAIKKTKTITKKTSNRDRQNKSYQRRANAERSSLNRGLRSIKSDTNVIKKDTTNILKDTSTIKAQNTITHQGIEVVTINQVKNYLLDKRILTSVGVVGAGVGSLAVALDEGLRNILAVQIAIAVLLGLGLVGFALYITEKLKTQEKVQKQLLEVLEKEQNKNKIYRLE